MNESLITDLFEDPTSLENERLESEILEQQQIDAYYKQREKQVELYNANALVDPDYADLRQVETYEQFLQNGSTRHLHWPTREVSERLNLLDESFPNFSEVTHYIKGRYDIALKADTAFGLPVLNLQGAPGIGKTLYVHRLTESLGLPLHDIRVAQMLDLMELVGNSPQWGHAKPGRIAEILLKEETKTAQPVVFFDELCMAKDNDHHSVIHPLYTLFEPDSAVRFKDQFLGLELDASHMICITATNNIERLRPALGRNRS